MLYIIGLGLSHKGISLEGLEIAKRCKKVYLENYTVDFPYSVKGLKDLVGKNVYPADREFVESFKIIDDSAKKDVALLVYGSPLMATTHIALVQEARESKVKCRVIHASSILEGVAETGLQLYKFGKITSMPKWQKNYSPDSFIKIIKENQSIKAHTLILSDIGLTFKESLKQFEKSLKDKSIKIKKIIVCSVLGTAKKRIIYRKIEDLKEEEIINPFCFIIPGKLHFSEEEFLKRFEK